MPGGKTAGPGFEAAVPLARQHQLKQSMIGVAGRFNNPRGFTGAQSVVKVLDGWTLTSTDALGCLHDPLQCLVVGARAVPVPHSDASSQDALR